MISKRCSGRQELEISGEQKGALCGGRMREGEGHGLGAGVWILILSVKGKPLEDLKQRGDVLSLCF